MTDPSNHEALKRLRLAFRQVTREHDRLMLLVADPETARSELDDHLGHVRVAISEYLEIAQGVALDRGSA